MRPFRAFALVEFTVVVLVLSLLAGVLFPLVRSEMDKALADQTLANIRAIADACGRYYAHTGAWPVEDSDEFDDARATAGASRLVPLIRMPCFYRNVHDREGWGGPYLEAGARAEDGTPQIAAPRDGGGFTGIVDAWGHPILMGRYSKDPATGSRGGLVLVSFGKDGTRDTDDEGVVRGTAAGDDVVMVVSRNL